MGDVESLGRVCIFIEFVCCFWNRIIFFMDIFFNIVIWICLIEILIVVFGYIKM